MQNEYNQFMGKFIQTHEAVVNKNPLTLDKTLIDRQKDKQEGLMEDYAAIKEKTEQMEKDMADLKDNYEKFEKEVFEAQLKDTDAVIADSDRLLEEIKKVNEEIAKKA